MSATIKEDAAAMTLICEGHWFREMTRGFTVQGMTGRTHAIMMEAVAELVAQDYEPWHPYDATHGLHVVSYQPKLVSISECSVYVTVRYVNSLLPIWHGGGALRTIQTDKDINGNRVTVTHNGVVQPGVMTVMAPDSTFEVMRIQPSLYVDPMNCEAINGPIDPTVIKKNYTGRINGSLWQGRAAGTCIIESVDYDNQGLGTTAWNMRYCLRDLENGWDPEVVWVDRDTGEPGVNLVVGTGVKTVRFYPFADFSALHLELPAGMANIQQTLGVSP